MTRKAYEDLKKDLRQYKELKSMGLENTTAGICTAFKIASTYRLNGQDSFADRWMSKIIK